MAIEQVDNPISSTNMPVGAVGAVGAYQQDQADQWVSGDTHSLRTPPPPPLHVRTVRRAHSLEVTLEARKEYACTGTFRPVDLMLRLARAQLVAR